MTVYLSRADIDELMSIASLGPVRDAGLLLGALGRPTATMFGVDLFPTLPLKAGALLHGIVTSHPLVDGNKRLGWYACVTFLDLNDQDLEVSDAQGFALVLNIANHVYKEVEDIAVIIDEWIS